MFNYAAKCNQSHVKKGCTRKYNSFRQIRERKSIIDEHEK